VNVAYATSECLASILKLATRSSALVANLILQDLSEQEESDTTKHSLREKVGWYSTCDNVAGNNWFIFVLFHRREGAEDEYKESN
jgi:hypothetical protein